MAYIQFDKNQLVNLEYSLSKELIRSNQAGAYSSTTIIGCNTRKYHGLLVCPQTAIDEELHVLLSSIDESIIQHDSEFNLAIHRYPDTWSPKGHKYIVDFESEPIPAIYYRIGRVHLKKEMLLASDHRILIRYTLLNAQSPARIKLKPFLAYRSRHKLSKSNVFVENKYTKIPGGIKTRMYQGYSYLHFQFSRDAQYVHVPDWYYNIEYPKDLERGYEAHEDLYCPGYFEIDLIQGTSFILSVGISETNSKSLARLFTNEVAKRTPRNNFKNCLDNSANQFIVKSNNNTEIIAGFPWFGRWGRDTLIALPGLTLSLNKYQTCKDAIDTLINDMDGPLMPNVGHGDATAFNSIDAPLWLFWTLQQYQRYANVSKSNIWEEYGPVLKLILNGLSSEKVSGIKMLENGLLYASIPGKALTWMDAIVDGKPITARSGLAVEINALWYNAIMFSLEMASLSNDHSFVSRWLTVADKIPASFKETFWSKDKGYLADVVNDNIADWSVRPNMVFATSLPYNPISEKIRQLILEKIKHELLTPRGLRTLSPKNPAYIGHYEGTIKHRDRAYHQGTVWPWLMGHYAEGYLKIHEKSGLSHIKDLYDGMEKCIYNHGVGSISEVYSGDPPHQAGGAISQAWSVAEIIRIAELIEKTSI